MRRFYFTLYTGDAAMDDYIGNIRGARRKAQAEANRIGEIVYINDCRDENIVDCIYPDEND